MRRDGGARDVAVGALVSAATLIAAAALLSVGSPQRMLRRQVEYQVRFANSTGLAAGSPVKLVGMQIGNVTEITLPEDLNQRYILVTLSIDRGFHERIREDSEAALKYLTLLGGEKFIEITTGSPSRAVLPPGSFIPVPREGGLEALTARSEDIAADMQVITAFFRRTVEQIERGEGFLGQILTNPDFGSETLTSVRQTSGSMSRIAAGIERGEGLAGRLLVDREYGKRQTDQIDRALSRLGSILEGIDSGEGALGQLVAKDSGAERAIADLTRLAAALKKVLETMEKGEGLAGRMLNDEEYGRRITANLERITSNLASITDKIDNGEGTLGGLVNDDSVVQGLKDVVFGMQKSRVFGSLIRHYRKKGEEAREKDPRKGEIGGVPEGSAQEEPRP